MQVRAELVRPSQQRAQARRRVALPAFRRLGAQQRRERRHLHRQVRSRQRSRRVALQPRLVGEPVVGAGERAQGLVAARGVAVGLGGGDGRLAEQVDRGGDPVAPEPAQRGQRRTRVLADDEAMRHVAHAGGAGGAERRATRLRVAHPHRRAQRRRAVADLVEKARQVRRQVVERAAGGDDVDEAKERRAQLVVLRGEVHRAVVERLERMAAVGRETRRAARGRPARSQLERRGRVRAAIAHRLRRGGLGRRREIGNARRVRSRRDLLGAGRAAAGVDLLLVVAARVALRRRLA